MIDRSLAEPFEPYLLTGERVVWAGRPKQGLLLTGRDAFLVPFSLLWGGFAIFWNWSVWTMAGAGAPDWFFRIWGLPFLVAGLYFIFGRFLHDAAIRRNTAYAVTTQRVLILRGSGSSKLKSLDINRLPTLELSERGDGTGTIAFASTSMFSPYMRNGLGWWTPSVGSTSQFYRVANPREVYELIRKQA